MDCIENFVKLCQFYQLLSNFAMVMWPFFAFLFDYFLIVFTLFLSSFAIDFYGASLLLLNISPPSILLQVACLDNFTTFFSNIYFLFFHFRYELRQEENAFDSFACWGKPICSIRVDITKVFFSL